MILAGDIGGTKVNLAAYEVVAGALQVRSFETYHSHDFSNLEAALARFRAQHHCQVDAAAFGIAGPVKNNSALLTNLRWMVDGDSVAQTLGLKHVGLVNDLVALAYGIAGLSSGDFLVLNPGDPKIIGNQAVIAAGTGLGEAALAWDGTRHIAMASEGGNSDFAPRTDLDIDLLKYLRAKFGNVIWEHVLSGPGLVNIYEFLRDTRRGEEPAWLIAEMKEPGTAAPAVITRNALAHKSPLCEQALDIFATYYGAESANMALKFLSIGGVFIGGGIAPKIVQKLTDGSFMKAFGDNRYHDLLSAMPVKVVLNDKTGLLGAARFAAKHTGLIQ